ncbi:hypothetical protein J3Q64DRAFT_1695068 [Phycomyces blakesleeanus]|uniref:Uncharacterized protein n=1 Tax=Phycomyces blakesleeanus TaxID=4837 RepID=A0ABR3B9W2_PHYBL
MDSASIPSRDPSNHHLFSSGEQRIISNEGYESIMLFPKNNFMVKDIILKGRNNNINETSSTSTTITAPTISIKYAFVYGSTLHGNWVYDTLSHEVDDGLTVRMNTYLDKYALKEPVLIFDESSVKECNIPLISSTALANSLRVHEEVVKHLSTDFYITQSQNIVLNIGLQFGDNDGYTFMANQELCLYFQEAADLLESYLKQFPRLAFFVQKLIFSVPRTLSKLYMIGLIQKDIIRREVQRLSKMQLTLKINEKAIERTKKINSEVSLETVVYNIPQSAIVSLKKFKEIHGTKELMIGDRCVCVDRREKNIFLFGKKGTVVGMRNTKKVRVKFDEDLFKASIQSQRLHFAGYKRKITPMQRWKTVA